MLRVLFEWLDSHRAVYWLLAAVPTLALGGWAALGLKSASAKTPASPPWQERGFVCLLLFFLLAWRWPYLFSASEFNPDESEFIAGAMTLRHDPVFWGSVDGTTSGPLNFYALLPLSLLGLPFDYFTARLTDALLFWAALIACYRLFCSLAGPALAKLAVLPAAVFYAAATERDFVHYSSESVSLGLIALAALWSMRRPASAMFVAGLLPWAKLQTAPLAAVFVSWQIWTHWVRPGQKPGERWRHAGALAATALLPSLLGVAAVALSGQLEPFYRRYLLQNVAYVGDGFPLRAVVAELAARAQDTGHLTVWGGGMAMILLAGLFIHGRRQLRPNPLFWLSVALVGAAFVCILTPGRTSLHYLRFLIFPLTLCTGSILADLWSQPVRPAVAGVALFCSLLPLGWRLTLPAPEVFGRFAEHWRHPRTALGNILHAYRQPGASLAIWGWLNHTYVEAGMPQATRDTLSVWAILPSAQRDYYRQVYLADLQRSHPVFFVDTVGAGSPYLNKRPTQGHETFPALADHIRRHYRLLIELSYARVYARTDVAAPSWHDLQRLIAAGRMEGALPTDPDVMPLANPPRADLKGRSVQVIEPPTTLTWRLGGTEREARIEYGFLPRAYLEGRTNGADVIVELRMPGQPPLQIFSRELDPVNRPADRGMLSARMILPPYPPGTSLTLRATNGKFGDGAWDWVYFAGLQFVHSPFYLPSQFPRFNRTPDEVIASYPYLIGDSSDLLMLPPPADLIYHLDGDERMLRFEFGLQEGAYTNGGQTDGATYRVELQRRDHPPQILFERNLQPLDRPADRGRQHAEVILPPTTRAGDRLVIRIDPAGSNSWDWTSLSSLELR
jgi:hypothetical protein